MQSTVKSVSFNNPFISLHQTIVPIWINPLTKCLNKTAGKSIFNVKKLVSPGARKLESLVSPSLSILSVREVSVRVRFKFTERWFWHRDSLQSFVESCRKNWTIFLVFQGFERNRKLTTGILLSLLGNVNVKIPEKYTESKKKSLWGPKRAPYIFELFVW